MWSYYRKFRKYRRKKAIAIILQYFVHLFYIYIFTCCVCVCVCMGCEWQKPTSNKLEWRGEFTVRTGCLWAQGQGSGEAWWSVEAGCTLLIFQLCFFSGFFLCFCLCPSLPPPSFPHGGKQSQKSPRFNFLPLHSSREFNPILVWSQDLVYKMVVPGVTAW